MEKTKFIISIEGMMCSHCVKRVEKALAEIKGIKSKVSLEDKKAYIELKKEVSIKDIVERIEDAGYSVVNVE